MLALVVTGAPLTRHVHAAVPLARDLDPQVAVVATDAASDWLDHEALALLDVPVLTSRSSPAPATLLAPPSTGAGHCVPLVEH